ncbi:metal-dependent hydrolase [Hazenella coriacea]|uniref:UPF0173 metal-dependent hydrolase EDD58_101415 n=1 Tax=Hazenella coriacea TaxID=1179467 RepID=A0A4R3LEK0_9BACL|nr:metal-dependent hydrolase [Hazenella coriacea]TCS96774.1 L-ascorbate metabolism protein UlaG (beta-lactamase superfamily) [Hazenella coriacea]
MKITYHGHSCFELKHKGTRLIIDPFLSGNPVAISKPEDIKVDYILVTHGHGDHVGDTEEIAKQNDATVIAPHELSVWLGGRGVSKVHGMGVGGGYSFDFGHVKMTLAYHGSGYEAEGNQIVYMGHPAGYLLTIDGKTIYHAGDTALFSDMKWINLNKPIDLALLPIGDNYTMGPEEALLAAEWLQAKHVIPMHFNTFPLIRQDGKAFVQAVQEKGIKGTYMKVGEKLTF